MAEKKKILYIVEAMGGGVFTYIVDPLMYRLVTSGTEKAISDGRLTQKRRPASERCLIWHYLGAIQRRSPMR